MESVLSSCPHESNPRQGHNPIISLKEYIFGRHHRVGIPCSTRRFLHGVLHASVQLVHPSHAIDRYKPIKSNAPRGLRAALQDNAITELDTPSWGYGGQSNRGHSPKACDRDGLRIDPLQSSWCVRPNFLGPLCQQSVVAG